MAPAAVVPTVTVTGCAALPLICNEEPEKAHVGAGLTVGLRVQLRLTVPVNDPMGVTNKLNFALCPALMVWEVDDPEAAPTLKLGAATPNCLRTARRCIADRDVGDARPGGRWGEFHVHRTTAHGRQRTAAVIGLSEVGTLWSGNADPGDNQGSVPGIHKHDGCRSATGSNCLGREIRPARLKRQEGSVHTGAAKRNNEWADFGAVGDRDGAGL